jgi:CRP-like cAMP-binding protein
MKNSIAFPNILRSGILVDMPEDAKVRFLDECSVRQFIAPTEFLTQGGSSSGMFIIAHGRVEVSYCDNEGNVTLIHLAGPGECLGEVEALSEQPCAASCKSLPNTTVLFCPTPLLYEQIHSTVFVRNLMSVLHERLIRDNKFRSVNQFYSVDQRLGIYLCQFSSPTRPEVKISQSYLANVVGCSRQTINKKLADLRDDGLIALGKSTITILQREALLNRVDELL